MYLFSVFSKNVSQFAQRLHCIFWRELCNTFHFTMFSTLIRSYHGGQSAKTAFLKSNVLLSLLR